jgi:hypothetical protein
MSVASRCSLATQRGGRDVPREELHGWGGVGQWTKSSGLCYVTVFPLDIHSLSKRRVARGPLPFRFGGCRGVGFVGRGTGEEDSGSSRAWG